MEDTMQDSRPLLPVLGSSSSSSGPLRDQVVFYLTSARRACYITAVAGYILYGIEMIALYTYGMVYTHRMGFQATVYTSHFVPTITLLPVAVCLHLVWLLPQAGADGAYFPTWPALQALKRRGVVVLLVNLVSAILITPWFVLVQPFISFKGGDSEFGTGFEVYVNLLVFYCPAVYLFYLTVLAISAFLLYWCDKGMRLAVDQVSGV